MLETAVVKNTITEIRISNPLYVASAASLALSANLSAEEGSLGGPMQFDRDKDRDMKAR